MASRNCKVRIIESCKITALSHSSDSATELSLPLTFFDTFFLKFHPVERIFFYQLADTTSENFHSSILPKLKSSLSLALHHFLPLAGNLIWPSDAVKPFIFYSPPNNNSVSLTVAESEADFHHLSGDGARKAVESHPYIPELNVSDTSAAIIAFQITFFPNQGFCIGVTSHHAILDGKSVTMFMKAWAHFCKHSTILTLPPELTPFYDRTIIQDPDGLDMIYVNNWSDFFMRIDLDRNRKSLKLLQHFAEESESNLVRATYKLSREDIKKLRQKVFDQHNSNDINSLHLSTFVLTYSYVVSAIFKAKSLEKTRKVLVGFIADCRARLDPPIPANYFGNCGTAYKMEGEAEHFMAENGFGFAVKGLSEVIKGIEKGPLEGAKEKLTMLSNITPGSVEIIGVAGSPRFEVYVTDFGWGTPKKVEIVSIDRTGSISLAESGSGVEIGVALKEHEMEMFDCFFVNGLKNI